MDGWAAYQQGGRSHGAFPGDGEPGNEEQNLPHGWLGRHILDPQEVQCRGKITRSCAETAKEPKKQNACTRKRVALEEEDRLKLDRCMTEPVHKVRTMFPKHPHVVYLPCHPFTIMVHAIH